MSTAPKRSTRHGGEVRGVTAFVEGTLLGRHDWAEGLATFTLDAAIDPFEPGQFVNLVRAGDPLDEGRSYSIASAPGARLELFVARVGSGGLSPQLFELDVGSHVHVSRRPLGFFTPKFVPPCTDLWLVATGTGLAPFLSMLRAGALGSLCERLVLVHGVRELEHLAYRAELERMAEAPGSKLVYLPALSRAASAGGELSGRVTSLFANGALEAAAAIAIGEQSHLLLCGNPGMIQDMEALLKARGLRKHRTRAPGHYSYEKYW